MNTEKELQEKLDWLEEKGFAKFNDEYIFTQGHTMKFHEETVLSAPLGMLKASYQRNLEAAFKKFQLPQEKEIEIQILDRETYVIGGEDKVYLQAMVFVKINGVESYRFGGEFMFKDHPKGDMKYYEEVIRGSFL